MDLTNYKKEIIQLEKELKNTRLLSNKKEIIPELASLLTNAIDKRVKGKTGIAFSGGVDSTLIAFICKKLKKDIALYNVGLKGSKDTEWAKKISKHYKWKLKQIIVTLEEAEAIIKKIVKMLPDPSVVKVGVACPEYIVLKQAKKDKVKTVLGGLGSEEIFAGYERHLLAKDKHKECWIGLKTLYEKDLSRDFAVSNALKVNILCPYLDKDLVKYAMQIDSSLKITEQEKKIILRETAVHLGLKKEFAFRKKLAAQYGSGFHKAIDKLSRKNGFKFKKDYLNSLK